MAIFSDIIERAKQTVGLTPKPKPMVFPVGEGLKPEQKAKAEVKVQQLITQAPPKETNFFADLARDLPRSVAALTVKATGEKEYVPGMGTAGIPILPEVERFVFGDEPIKVPQGKLETGLAVLGAMPILPGKKKVAEVAAKEILEEAPARLKALKGLEPLIAEARKYKSAEEFVKAKSVPEQLSHLGKQAEGVSYETFKRNLVRNIGSVERTEKISDDVAQSVFERLQRTAQRGEFSDEATLFKDLGGRNPKRLVGDETITVYRATPVNKLRAGDFVSPDKTEAGFYTSATKKIYPFQVKKSDLVAMEGSMGGGQELLYIPKGSKQGTAIEFFKSPREFYDAVNSKSQLTDFYNQVVKGAEEIVEGALPAGLKALKIPQKAARKIVEVGAALKSELEAVKGRPLTYEEVKKAAQASEMLRRVTTRQATLAREAQIQATKQHIAALAKGKGVSREFLTAFQRLSSEATALGRQLNALQIEALPELQSIKIEMVRKIQQAGYKADKIFKAAKGVDFTNPQQAGRFYRQFIKPKFSEIIDEYRYANLLSSPKTHIVNAFSNLLQATVLRPAVRLVSGGIDLVGSGLAGRQREYYLRQVPAYYRGLFNAIGDAFTEAAKVLRGERFVLRPDLNRIPTGSKVTAPLMLIPRLMEASDIYFKTLITAGEKEALAYKYLRQGIPRKKITSAFIGRLESQAEETALEYLFRKSLDPNNVTGHGNLLSKIDELTSAVYGARQKVPLLGWFIPFIMTPMNILKQGIEFSPVGVLALAGNMNKTEQLAKTLIGSMAFGGAAFLAAKGDSTWAPPRDAKEREYFFASGRVPYSLKVGPYWISYSRLGPLSYPLALTSAIKYYFEQNSKAATEENITKTAKVVQGMSRYFADQSYVEGIGDLYNLLYDDYAAGRLMANLPSQLIPLSSLVRWANTVIDQVYRKTATGFTPEAVIETLAKQIPLVSRTLTPFREPLGEESRRQLPFFNLLSPLGVTVSRGDYEELYQLLLERRRTSAELNKMKADLRKELGL